MVLVLVIYSFIRSGILFIDHITKFPLPVFFLFAKVKNPIDNDKPLHSLLEMPWTEITQKNNLTNGAGSVFIYLIFCKTNVSSYQQVIYEKNNFNNDISRLITNSVLTSSRLSIPGEVHAYIYLKETSRSTILDFLISKCIN